jgi:hypothetical protein
MFDRTCREEPGGARALELRPARVIPCGMARTGARTFLALLLAVASACAKQDGAPGTAPPAPAEPAPAEPAPAEPAPAEPAPSKAATQDEAGVHAAFEAYRAAILARDGKSAVTLVDRKTIETYQQYLDLARTVDRAGLRRLDWMGKFMVLRLRHEFDRQALAALTGESLFVVSIERGWISDTAVRASRAANVTLDGPRAGLSLTERPDVPVFFFAWETDVWKFSLWKTFPLAELGMQKLFEQSKAKDELAWIVAVIEAISPRQFDPAMLEGPPR